MQIAKVCRTAIIVLAQITTEVVLNSNHNILNAAVSKLGYDYYCLFRSNKCKCHKKHLIQKSYATSNTLCMRF